MRVEWAIACRYAEVQPTGVMTIVGGPLTAFKKKEFPADIVFYVAAQFFFTDNEADMDHALSMKFRGPNLEELDELTGTIHAGHPNPNKREGWENMKLMADIVRFTAAQEGTYTLHIAIGGSYQKMLPFDVRQGTS